MHNLFLGLIKEHFQNILGYRPKPKTRLNGESSLSIIITPTENNPLPSDPNVKASIRKIVAFLKRPCDNKSGESLNEVRTKLGGPKSRIHREAFLYVARGLNCINKAATPQPYRRATSDSFMKKGELCWDVIDWVSYTRPRISSFYQS